MSRHTSPAPLLILYISWLSFSGLSFVAGLRQPGDILSYFENFQDAFSFPAINDITQQISWDGWATDVIGRIDVTNRYDGAELNTEYFFGLWATEAVINSTRLLPIPVGNSQVTEAAMQGSTGSVSFIMDWDFGQGIGRWPVQVDLWARFNGQGQITQYDLTFRRFAWFWQTTIPFVLPFIARDADMNFTVIAGASPDGKTIDMDNGQFIGGDGGIENLTSSQLIQKRAAIDICRTHETYCTGSNQQYTDTNDCLNTLRNVKRLGNAWEFGQDTTLCRYVHRGMVQYRPQIHCEHIGPTGGDMCIPREYTPTVDDPPYEQTFVAPTDYPLPARYASASQNTKDQLSALATQIDNDLTPTAFAINSVVFLFALYVATIVTHQGFTRFLSAERYSKGLSEAHKRNCVTYVIEAVVTTAFFGIQAWSCSKVLTEDFTRATVNGARVVAFGVSLLYLFEMFYRSGLRATLLFHHIFTIFICCFTDVIVVETDDPSYTITGLVWLYQATTEQTVFIGLLLYRLNFRSRALVNFLRFAAIQSFITKLASTIYVLVWWIIAERQNVQSIAIAYSVFLVIIVVALFGVQGWSTWVVWTISKKAGSSSIETKAEKGFHSDEESAANFETEKEIPRIPRRPVHARANLSGQTLAESRLGTAGTEIATLEFLRGPSTVGPPSSQTSSETNVSRLHSNRPPSIAELDVRGS